MENTSIHSLKIQTLNATPKGLSYTTRKTCRVCNSTALSSLFTLGTQYVNNFLNDKHQLETAIKAPLEMIMCNKCSLVQLKDTAPQELLYAGFYWYRSGVTETMKKALRDVSLKIEENFCLKKGDLVLDIGSNDGTLLRSYERQGILTAGVEPARNLCEQGKIGIDFFINDFWNADSYTKNIPKKAKIITALGMFYDMEDPNQFIADSVTVMQDDGVFIAQLMCLHPMLETNDVGNICHEHLEFYSLASLDYLYHQNGLEIFDIEINNVNGGSYRLYARKIGSKVEGKPHGLERVQKIREKEKYLQNPKTYTDFFNRIEKNKNDCVDFIKAEVSKGKKVWIYGASTKGNVILQYYGLDHTLIEGAAERSPEKWDKYTVGSMIPIFSEEKARAARPDYFLVLPYAFFDEMYLREKKWRESGGQFIVPLPTFRIVQ